MIDLHPVEGARGNFLCDPAVVIDLGKIAHPPQQAVDYTRRPAPATCDLVRAGLVDIDS